MATNTETATLPSTSEVAEKPMILIVDDSRLMRVAIKKILKDDFSLAEAVDGEDAWEKIQEQSEIQGIFSDLSMPNLDGYGLLERVRNSSDARIRDLPFVVITGKEGDVSTLKQEIRALGGTDVVCKPFKSEEIIERTKSFIFAAQETAPMADMPQGMAAEVVEPVHSEVIQSEAGSPVTSVEAPHVVEMPELDEKTGLPTYEDFTRIAQAAIEAANGQQAEVGIVRAQIDNFEEIREHGMADEVITAFAMVMEGLMRPGYAATSMGDGQFAVVLPNEDVIAGMHWAQRVLSDFEDSIYGRSDATCTAHVSMGMDVQLVTGAVTLDNLLEAAHRRMLVAQQAGGHQVFKDDAVSLESLAEERRLAEEQAELHRREEEAAKQAALEAEAIRKQEEEARRKQEEELEARRKEAEEELRRRAEEEEKARLLAEEEESQRKAQAVALALAEQMEQERLAAEEQARLAAEEALRVQELHEKARKIAEEKERQQREEEEARLRFGLLTGLVVRVALPFMRLGNWLFRLKKHEQLDSLRKRLR